MLLVVGNEGFADDVAPRVGRRIHGVVHGLTVDGNLEHASCGAVCYAVHGEYRACVRRQITKPGKE